MRVLLALDKFKGSLSAVQACAALADGISAAAPSAIVDRRPIADGGDGTLDAAVAAGFVPVPITVSGPTGEPVSTAYARRGDEAIVELATACGLARLPGGRPDPLGASSIGVGQAIVGALDAGCHRIVLAIGGSASTDGGAGLLRALGARLLDSDGVEIGPGGGGLADLTRLDLSELNPALPGAEIVVARDVDNPLLGPRGAATVYGPQKGADAAEVRTLEANLGRWADAVALATGADRRDDAGAGAAGGVGFAALAVLGARLVPGIDLLLDLVGFPAALSLADLVVTGEGSLDEQTLHGKAPAGVAAAARARGVPTVAVAGRVLLSPERLAAAGISAAYGLSDLEPDPERSMVRAAELLDQVARVIARDWILEP